MSKISGTMFTPLSQKNFGRLLSFFNAGLYKETNLEELTFNPPNCQGMIPGVFAFTNPC